MVGQSFEFPVDGRSLAGWLALPDSGHGPGVLVIHEAWGLSEHVREICERLAREGFVALAPDLFGGRTAGDLSEARELAAGLEPEGLSADLEGAVGALLNHHAVDGSRVAAVGLCMGGHLALFAASRNWRVAAVVDFYGVHPGIPLDLSRLAAPVLAVFGDRDEFVPAAAVEALRADLSAAGTRASVVVEPGVGHAFMDETRPDRHDAAAAARGWDRMLAFLRAELS
jgi:carboxymethylenebutenolidase